MSAEDNIAYRDGITGSHFAIGRIDWIITPHQVSLLIRGVWIIDSSFLSLEYLDMLLNICSLDVSGFIKRFLSIGLSHVGTFSSFILDRVPGIFHHSSCNYPQACYISAVEGDVTSHKSITENPFVKVGVIE